MWTLETPTSDAYDLAHKPFAASSPAARLGRLPISDPPARRSPCRSRMHVLYQSRGASTLVPDATISRLWGAVLDDGDEVGRPLVPGPRWHRESRRRESGARAVRHSTWA